jgi:hypothetical protein
MIPSIQTPSMKSPAVLNWAVSEGRRKIKLKAIEYLGGFCQKCGYDRCPDALEFHHRNPKEKDFHISNGNYRRWDRIQAELDKCDLLCANCHREYHAVEKQARVNALRERAYTERQVYGPPVKVTCKECGSESILPPAEAARWVNCSKKCAAKSAEKANWPSDVELASLVMTTPMSTLAKQLGVSDAAVNKRCRKRGIPTRPRGYWAALETMV